ncbi:MAG TPA: hypothetical protein VJJ20_01390 [Candidatus Paceibacterota bacterium]
MDNFDTLNRNVDTFNAAVGAGFWDVVFAHPLLYVGYVFAFVAAIAFLVFLRGFLSGLPKVFTMDAHEEHQEHHRTRVTWGFFMLLYLFIIWEIVRWIAGLFGAFAP